MIRHKRTREKRTVTWMVGYYCRKKHGKDALCEECSGLLEYCLERVDKCPKWPDKPTCAKCTSHCYSKTYRQQIRQVMRFAGPRMLLHRPGAALQHLYRQLTSKAH